MSEANKSFQHQANTKGVHLGSRIICGPFKPSFPFWGVVVGAHLRYHTVPLIPKIILKFTVF